MRTLIIDTCFGCTRLLTEASYFRHNNKTLELSNPVRLTGVSPNARLELIKLSRSANVVSVALQLPESEIQGVVNGRMMDKFPSTTSLWQILRRFESGAAGGLALQKNLTARGVPSTADGEKGAGRLYYETPVLQYMGREVSSFVDLQKSLGRLGFNGGSILLRLNFRATKDPLEEAMQNIGAYFQSVEGDGNGNEGALAGSAATTESVPDVSQATLAEGDSEIRSVPHPIPSPPPLTPAGEPVPSPVEDAVTGASITYPNGEQEASQTSKESAPIASSEPTVTGPNQRRISVHAPSSSTTLRAAQQAHNESDYIPSIAHAKLHQNRLQGSTHNQRLASYAEDENQQKAKARRLADTKALDLRIRFPDQTMVDTQFTNLDTAATLYECVRGLLRHEDAPFSLRYNGSKGQKEVPKYSIPQEPKEAPTGSTQRLIADLGIVDRTLVTFVWEEGASTDARRDPSLKAEHAQNAKEIQVQTFQGKDEEDTSAPDKPLGNTKAGGGERKGMPAWMKKTLGKK